MVSAPSLVRCLQCNKDFATVQALAQHTIMSPAHRGSIGPGGNPVLGTAHPPPSPDSPSSGPPPRRRPPQRPQEDDGPRAATVDEVQQVFSDMLLSGTNRSMQQTGRRGDKIIGERGRSNTRGGGRGTPPPGRNPPPLFQDPPRPLLLSGSNPFANPFGVPTGPRAETGAGTSRQVSGFAQTPFYPESAARIKPSQRDAFDQAFQRPKNVSPFYNPTRVQPPVVQSQSVVSPFLRPAAAAKPLLPPQPSPPPPLSPPPPPPPPPSPPLQTLQAEAPQSIAHTFCENCDRYFFHPGYREEHARICKTGERSKINKTSNTSVATFAERTQDGTAYGCADCDMYFLMRAAAESHACDD